MEISGNHRLLYGTRAPRHALGRGLAPLCGDTEYIWGKPNYIEIDPLAYNYHNRRLKLL